MKTQLTLKSGNIKTGPIPVSTSSRKTCPDNCAIKNNGCYAEAHYLGMHWAKVTAGIRGDAWKDFIDKIASLPAGQLWRHNQAGDLAGINNTIDAHKLEQLTQANKGKRGFTYTHKPVLDSKVNARAIRRANKGGFTINLSADNLKQADKLKALNIAPVVVVVDQNAPRLSYTPAGNKVVICPAQQRNDVTCASCKLCAIADTKSKYSSGWRVRDFIIGFRAHGVHKNKVSEMVGVHNQ